MRPESLLDVTVQTLLMCVLVAGLVLIRSLVEPRLKALLRPYVDPSRPVLMLFYCIGGALLLGGGLLLLLWMLLRFSR